MADYFSDGGDILKNKLGITDADEFEKIEQEIVAQKSADLLNEKTPKKFEFSYLKYLHKSAF